jgi:hypothetical protein
MDMNGRVLSCLDIEDVYVIFEKKSDQMKLKAIINSLAIKNQSHSQVYLRVFFLEIFQHVLLT